MGIRSESHGGVIMRSIRLLLLPCVAISQPRETKYVVIKGSAEVKVPVDYYHVFESVPSYSSSTKTASDSNRAGVLRMMDVLRKYEVADSDFQTNTNSSRFDIIAKDPEHRHSVTYSAQVNFRRFKSYDSLVQDLEGLGGFDVSVGGNGSNTSALYKVLA